MSHTKRLPDHIRARLEKVLGHLTLERADFGRAMTRQESDMEDAEVKARIRSWLDTWVIPELQAIIDWDNK